MNTLLLLPSLPILHLPMLSLLIGPSSSLHGSGSGGDVFSRQV
jgi:hypothetical protein